MDLKMIRNKTNGYLKKHLMSVIKLLVVIALIEFGFGIIFKNNRFMQYFVNISYFINKDVTKTAGFLRRFTSGNILTGLIVGLISNALLAGFTMALLSAVKQNKDVQLKDVFKSIDQHLISIVMISFISTIIHSFLNHIPIIGQVLQVIVNYMFAFTYFILKETKTTDGFEAIKLSVNETNGHKMSLFLINLYYYVIPYLGLVIVMASSLFVRRIPLIGSLIFLSGIILQSILSIIFLPYGYVATIMIYETVKQASIST